MINHHLSHAIAREKLCDLPSKIPPHIMHGGSIQVVSEWKKAHQACEKVFKNRGSPESTVLAAVSRMESYFK